MSPSWCWRTEARGCQRSSVHPPAIPLLAFCSLTSIHRATCKASRGEGTTAEKKTAVPGSADWSSSPRERKCIHDLREVGLPFPLPSASTLSRTQSTPEDLRPSHSALSERQPSPRIPADLRASHKVTDPGPTQSPPPRLQLRSELPRIPVPSSSLIPTEKAKNLSANTQE